MMRKIHAVGFYLALLTIGLLHFAPLAQEFYVPTTPPAPNMTWLGYITTYGNNISASWVPAHSGQPPDLPGWSLGFGYSGYWVYMRTMPVNMETIYRRTREIINKAPKTPRLLIRSRTAVMGVRGSNLKSPPRGDLKSNRTLTSDPAPAPQLYLEPLTIVFPPTLVNTTSNATLTIANKGQPESELSLTSCTLPVGPFPVVLNGGEQTSIALSFTPPFVADFSSTVTLVFSDGLSTQTQNIPLFCSATAPPTVPAPTPTPAPTQTPVPPGQPLLAEDWNTGTIDPTIWQTNTDPGARAQLQEIAPGDYAFYSEASTDMNNFNWGTWLYANAAFPRGNNLRCTFRTWCDPSKGDNPCAGDPSYAAINGPWHTNYFDFLPNIANDPLAAIQNISTGANPRTGYFIQTGDPWSSGAALSADFNSAFQASTTKQNALTVRVWLGDVDGARCEWSLNGTTWTVELDDRGWNPAHYPARLGWGTNVSAVFVDDIVVEDDNHTLPGYVPTPMPTPLPTPTPTPWPTPAPSPAPVPTQTPVPSGQPLLMEDWNTGTIDPTIWQTNTDRGARAQLQEIATGDFAFFSEAAPDMTYYTLGAGIYSNIAFPRGNNLRCTFRTWCDPGKVDNPWHGDPSHAAINGPWHTNNVNDYLRIETNQLAIIRNILTGAYPQTNRFAQTGDAWDTGGAGMSAQFNSAFQSSTTKQNGLTVRIWLSDVHGARCEWSRDGAAWTVEADNRGHNPAHNDNPVRLSWGTNISAAFVDDIVVEDDNHTLPGYVPTPTPTPLHYELTASANPPEGGSVTLPDGVTPANGGWYDSGASVTVSANSAAGYAFAGWSGDASGGNPSASVTMSAARSVTANFMGLPTAVLATTALDPTSDSPIPVTVTFSAPVTGFEAGDIIAINATVLNFGGSGSGYTFNLAPTGRGVISASFDAGVAQDSLGNPNMAATPLSLIYNGLLPTIWVDFGYYGTQSGSQTQPYQALADGINYVTTGGTIKVQAGNTTEKPRITKAMRIQAVGGTAIIGR